MSKLIYCLLIASLVIPMSLNPSLTEARGTLIKGSLPAVYYLASDGKRYVFPNEKIYFSWYENFDGVSEVDDGTLSSYDLGGNISYRPGTHLVKIQSNSTVYAVEPGGMLRAIDSEDTASSLYGNDWADRVHDLPDSFFAYYTVTSELDEPVYPEGSLLKDSTSGDYYVILDGQRRLLSEDGITANGLQTKYAITTDTSSYTAGSTITTEINELADTAQSDQGLNQDTTIEVSTVQSETNLLQDANNEVLATYIFSVTEEVEIKSLVLRVRAHSSTDSDDDPGGLIYEEEGGNIENIRFVTSDGTQLLASRNLSSDTNKDGQQDISFTGSSTLPVGQHTVNVLVDVIEEAPDGESYSTTLYLSDTSFEISGNETTDYTPESLTSGTVTVKTQNLAVSVASSLEDRYFLKGGNLDFVDMISFKLENSRKESVTISEFTLTGYIDEHEGDEDFVAGADSDNAGSSFTYVEDVVDKVELLNEETEELIGTQSTIQSSGAVAFGNIDLDLEAETSVNLMVRVHINSDAPFGQQSDRISFDIDDVEDDMTVKVTGTSQEVDVEAGSLNGGSNPGSYLTVSESGTLTIEGSGSGPARLIMGSEDNSIYSFTFTASEEEAMIIDTLTVRLLDSNAQRSVSKVKLRYLGESGYEYVDGNFVNSNATFEDLEIEIPQDDDLTVSILVDIGDDNSSARSGDKIGVAFETNTFKAYGATSGIQFDKDDLGEHLIDSTSIGSETFVRRNEPNVSLAADQPNAAQNRSDQTEIFTFTLGSEGEGNPELEMITFKITTSDVGYELNEVEEDNDLLEGLADINGDSSDDDETVEIIDEESGDTICEGSSGHIDFSIYDYSEGEIDTTPAGLNSAREDYGLIVCELNNPIRIYNDGRDYTFNLNTNELAPGAQNVRVTILDSDDFHWSDGTNTSLTENGDGISGLSLNSQYASFQ